MSLVFLHTADWQLGKPFASVRDDSKRHRLQQERLHTIRSLGPLAEKSGAAFILVAGDLFDSSQATKATVSAACSVIGSLGVPVIAIPGNHDHGGPGSIWEQEFFLQERDHLAPNLRVLLNPEPVVLETAVILPAPLLRRHDPGDPTAWIRTASFADFPPGLPRIVLAHGTVQGFGSAQDDDDGESSVANWIDLARLPETLAYIALGDWHGAKEISPTAWYSGTPEIDRFPKGAANEPGHVLQVTLSSGKTPAVEKISTSRFRWQQLAFRFTDDASLDLFESQLAETIAIRPDESLLHLTLEGSLGIAASARLEKSLDAWDSRLLRLKLENQVAIAPSDEEIAALTRRAADPLIAAVATQLVAQIDNETARLALRELHGHLVKAEN